MKSKKIIILLPDGIGLRNFVFTSFVEIGLERGWNIVFWNSTPYDLNKIGLREIKLKPQPSFVTDVLKRARKNIELALFEKWHGDKVYRTYYFPPSNKNLKARIKNFLVSFFAFYYRGENGLEKLRKKIKKTERKTKYYKNCLEILEKERPNFIFCTNQRPLNGIAPLVAAGDLGIPSATFIFSWDNLPKATMVVETDFYFVWSDYMRKELQEYYPYVMENQIIVSGSPQFEPHYDEKFHVEKESFYKEHHLEMDRKFLCFSGDDITTSPHDEFYLGDVARAVRELNENKEKLKIIFRRSPVDFSKRYDKVLEDYKDVIIPITPAWEIAGEAWNAILPTMKDIKVQRLIIENTFMVINLGSSMVFDYASHKKPCAYVNYNPVINEVTKDVRETYNYVHFRSMPSEKSVYWINDPNEISGLILRVLRGDNSEVIRSAEEWFKTINQFPPMEASHRIWTGIENVT